MLGTTGGVKELEGRGGNLDQSSRVQCVVDWFGPADLLTMGGGHNGPNSPEAKLLGGPVQENKEKARKASPLTYVSKDSAPFLIMHGDQDNVVPPHQSEDLAEALKKAGVEAKLQIVKGNKHAGPGFSTPENRRLIEEFFDKHLKGTAESRPPNKPRVLVTISKETTYITGPLRKDGYVNYLAAVNQRFREGVTRENNSAVLFWQAMGPPDINTGLRDRYFQMLGVRPLPEEGDYFVPLNKFVERLRAQKDPRVANSDANDPTVERSKAMKRPWSKEEFPVLADWLAANEKPLILLVAASKRPRRYDPLLCGDSNEGMLMAALLPAVNQAREVGHALVSRAMLRLHADKLDEAWSDLLACHRLARLAGQGPTLIDALVAINLDGMACSGDQAILQNVRLSASQAAKMRDDLAKLPPMPRMADKIDVAERFMFLDCVAMVARTGIELVERGCRSPRLLAANRKLCLNC